MLLDYQQGGMVLDGLLTFPDWSYGGETADQSTINPQTLVVLQGSATGLFAGNVKISILGAGTPHLATLNPTSTPIPPPPVSNLILDDSGSPMLDDSGGNMAEDS